MSPQKDYVAQITTAVMAAGLNVHRNIGEEIREDLNTHSKEISGKLDKMYGSILSTKLKLTANTGVLTKNCEQITEISNDVGEIKSDVSKINITIGVEKWILGILVSVIVVFALSVLAKFALSTL